jgi:RNA polymerase sigma factor for flagellar operon FliA
MEPVAQSARRLFPLSGEQQALERELWTAWREHGDEQARARLLELHLPYADVVARAYFARRLNDEIEFDDYLQFASTALIDAAGRYDPGRGVQFRTYAARRMHGEILNGIEHMTEKQQQIAARRHLLAQRRDEAGAIAREAADQASAADKLLRFVAEAGLAFALGWLLEDTALIRSTDERSRTIPFYGSWEMARLTERIASLVKALPPQERKVIHGHYFQQQAFEEVARDMDLTRGRISQIHRKALARLRESSRPLGWLDSG